MEDTVADLLSANKAITSVKQVQIHISSKMGLEVRDTLVRQVMRKDLQLGYRQAKIVSIQSNSERALV